MATGLHAVTKDVVERIDHGCTAFFFILGDSAGGGIRQRLDFDSRPLARLTRGCRALRIGGILVSRLANSNIRRSRLGFTSYQPSFGQTRVSGPLS